MLRLRKVELFGFKSFADRTSIVFPGTGIAGIVGPNGCGKSNIADAILWVLGEQSAKTLRSSQMADCIFNGTTERPPTNLAEVSLTLVDPKAGEKQALANAPLFSASEGAEESSETDAPTDTSQVIAEDEETSPAPGKPQRNRLGLRLQLGEIVVTRRLYRDGKSEYYLNGGLCRLRDIQEIFMGTGLGPQSYAIIEQGRIGQILSSRPSDRRALLEEAAGVTKYKTKKRLAEGKLEAARQNLLRLNDILEEVTKQLASLKRQASRARRYQQLRSESQALRRVLLATQLDNLTAGEYALSQQISEKAGRVAELSANLSHADQQQREGQLRQAELETRVRREQNRVGELMVALERAQARLADNRREQELAREQLEQLSADAGTHTATTARNAASLEQARQRLAATDARKESLRSETEELSQAATGLRERCAALETAVSELQHQRTERVHNLAAARADVARLEQTAELASQTLTRLRDSQEQLNREQLRLRTEEEEGRSRFDQARAAVIHTQEEATAAKESLGLRQREHSAAKADLDGLRRKLAEATAQEQALGDLIAQRRAFAEPVRKLLLDGDGNGHSPAPDAPNGHFKAAGVVADFAEFDPAYAELLQAYLKEELEYVVVDTYDTARSGVSLLRREATGHATFLVDSFSRSPVRQPETSAPAPVGQGLIGPLGDFLRINGPLGEEAKKVLPRLSHTYLVESPVACEALAGNYPDYSFLATDGTCYQGRLVSGGSARGHATYSLQQEMQDAAGLRSEIEPQVVALTDTVNELESRLGTLERKRATARDDLLQQEKSLLESEQRVMTVNAQQVQLQAKMEELAAESAATGQQQSSSLSRLAELRERVEEEERQLAVHEDTLRKETESYQQARFQSDEVLPLLADLRSLGAAMEERLTAGRAEIERLEEEARQQAAAHQAMRSSEERLQTRRGQLEQEAANLAIEVEERRRERATQENLCHQFDEELGQLRTGLAEGEAAVRRTRTELDGLREQRSALEVERARLQSDRNHLETTVQAEFGLTGAGLLTQTSDRMAGEALPQAEERDRELRRKLDNIGPVNMMALEEFQECEQRHGFLTRQREDVLASMEDVRQTIKELDEITHKRFADAFAAINQNFQETFKTLFNGGQATLRLTEADDPSDAGVELICQPPGKRLQNVLLLSGGEKALAALSLLIAIFRFHPSPFCILDEVDAPLDDTNIGRFTRLVEEMAPQTQFILVTHSKKTMEVASILYGVTMQGAVSQIVSVRFDEPAEAAA